MAERRAFEVYGIVSDRDVAAVRYVGATTRGREARFKAHLRAARAGDGRELYRWMSSELTAGHNIISILIESCDNIETLRLREEYWISEIPGLFNGNGGGVVVIPSPPTRARMSASAKARFEDPKERGKIWPSSRSRDVSEETREKLRQANVRRFEDPAERERIGSRTRGQTLSPEHRAALSRANTGKKHSPETLAKLRAAKAGKPSRPMHNRWHVNRGIVKPDCIFCNAIESA
jgi:hypothetical protein